MLLFNTIMIFIIGFLIYIAYPLREGMRFSKGYIADSYERNKITHDPEKYTISKNGVVLNYNKNFNSKIEPDIANNKEYMVLKLKNNSVPVANNYIWRDDLSFQENIISAEKIGYPLVVKPVFGEKGYNITVGIKDISELTSAINKINGRVLIENQLEGDEYRILVYNNKVIAITKRIRPCVIGNGIDTVKNLINNFNANKQDDFKCHNINNKLIKQQGYSLNDVPANNKKIIISNVANMSNGGEIEDVDIKNVHPDNINMFKKARQLSGLTLTGIDFITPSLSIPYYLMHGKCGILELNPLPGMEVHYNTKNDKDQFIDSFVNDLFEYRLT